jgi:hypothetical protein
LHPDTRVFCMGGTGRHSGMNVEVFRWRNTSCSMTTLQGMKFHT